MSPRTKEGKISLPSLITPVRKPVSKRKRLARSRSFFPEDHAYMTPLTLPQMDKLSLPTAVLAGNAVVLGYMPPLLFVNGVTHISFRSGDTGYSGFHGELKARAS